MQSFLQVSEVDVDSKKHDAKMDFAHGVSSKRSTKHSSNATIQDLYDKITDLEIIGSTQQKTSFVTSIQEQTTLVLVSHTTVDRSFLPSFH